MLLAAGRPLTLRGAGHSCDGQTVTDAEMLVTWSRNGTAAAVRDLGEGLVEVPAGTSWYIVERYLNQRGRSFPVLTDHLPVSVGGTLSVGGIGVGSVRYGMQIDHVERIQLTDGVGISRWCSRTDHPELFRFALGGLGSLGLIERVVLRTVPHQPYIHVRHRRHSTLAELIAYTEQIAQRDDIDIYCGSLRRGVLRSTTGRHSDPRRCDGDAPGFAVERLRVPADHARTTALPDDRVRMWSDYLVPAGLLEPMVDALRRRVRLDRLSVMLYLLVVRRSPSATPFAFAPAGPAPVSIGLGVYASVPRESAAMAAIRRMFGELMSACYELGGRPYLYGIHDFDDASAQRLYGPDLDRLAQLRVSHSLEHVNAHLALVEAAQRDPTGRAVTARETQGDSARADSAAGTESV